MDGKSLFAGLSGVHPSSFGHSLSTTFVREGASWGEASRAEQVDAAQDCFDAVPLAPGAGRGAAATAGFFCGLATCLEDDAADGAALLAAGAGLVGSGAGRRGTTAPGFGAAGLLAAGAVLAGFSGAGAGAASALGAAGLPAAGAVLAGFLGVGAGAGVASALGAADLPAAGAAWPFFDASEGAA